jgi:hypothetical protein
MKILILHPRGLDDDAQAVIVQILQQHRALQPDAEIIEYSGTTPLADENTRQTIDAFRVTATSGTIFYIGVEDAGDFATFEQEVLQLNSHDSDVVIWFYWIDKFLGVSVLGLDQDG